MERRHSTQENHFRKMDNKLFSTRNKTVLLAFLDNNRKSCDVGEHSKTKMKTWLCLVLPQHFSHVLLRQGFYSCLETHAILFFP